MAFREVRIEKVVFNIGAGETGDRLTKARQLLERLTGRKPLLTRARKREQAFKIRKGETIGTKVTFRGKAAEEMLKKSFEAVESKISRRSFDKFGSFSFGVREYIDFPGARYDPTIGLLGFDVCVSLVRPGKRVALRRRASAKIPVRHRVTPNEAVEFVQKQFKVDVYE